MFERFEVTNNYGGINQYNRVAKNPSYLALVVNGLGNLPLDEGFEKNKGLPFSVEAKIDHNNVVLFRAMIEEFSFYTTYVNETYKSLSDLKPACRSRVLRIIKKEYNLVRDTLVRGLNQEDIIPVIRENSDDIIAQVLHKLKERLYESSNLNNEIPIEDLETALEMVVGDAFVECKILENPNDSN